MQKNKKRPILVGIGSSAGGLEALQVFVKNLPTSGIFSYIIAQHLSPTHISLLTDLLSKSTSLNVVEAEDDLKPKEDFIYVCPPNKNIMVKNGIIKLSEPDTFTYGVKPSVDILFESLSQSESEYSVGIILSGTGSDGSRGVRAIKAEGGVTVAQELSSAKYDGMPFSAIHTGYIDLVLPPEQIYDEIVDIFKVKEELPNLCNEDKMDDLFNKIIAKLSKFKKVDFTRYKPTTLKRRIARRMASIKIDSLTKYSMYLQENESEFDELYNDVLINVTSFFRDSKSFDSLSKQLEEYINNHSTLTIRAWVAGCSTGEEPITLAIIISELLGNRLTDYKVQIFATDIDHIAIEAARSATYSASNVSTIPNKLRKKYFTVTANSEYKPISLIRDMCIYSVHDVIKDPPFLRLDLVSCKNLLIYFTSELQQQIINNFIYSLNNGGILALGKSENIVGSGKPLNILDSSNKIYSVNSFTENKKKLMNLSSTDYKDPTQYKIVNKTKETIETMILNNINSFIVPTCIVINEVQDLLFVKGQNPYIVTPQGERTDNIFKNIHPDLNIELRTALHNLNKEKNIVKTVHKKVHLYGGIEKLVRMVLIPMLSENIHNLVLICFQEEDEEYFQSALGHDLKTEKEKQLQLELDRTKTHMQTLLEEMESTNEEMQSLNEELQSSNEELQSSNEELETTNEELQSTNEELHTAYSELQNAYDSKKKEVSDHLTTKDKLQENTERLELAILASKLGISEQHVPIVQTDSWSNRFLEILGFIPDELPKSHKLMKQWFESKIHPDQKETYLIEFERFLRGDDVSKEFTLKLEHKNGKWIWVNYLIKALKRDADGRVLQFITTLQDITEDRNKTTKIESLNKKLEDMVKKQSDTIFNQQSRLSQITQETGIGIWEYDLETKEIIVTPKLMELLKINHDKLPKSLSGFLSLFSKESKELLKSKIEFFENKKIKQSKIDIELSSDKNIWIENNIRIHEDSKTKNKSIVSICLDVSREIQREKMLIQLADNSNIIEEFSEIGSFEYFGDKEVIYRSKNYCKLLNLNPINQTTVSLENFLEMIDKKEDYKKTIQKCYDSMNPYEIEYIYTSVNGEKFNISEQGKVFIKNNINSDTIKGIIKATKLK